MTMNWRNVIGMLVGGGLGFAYYKFVGCSTGTCPLTSNPYISTGYGAILGVLSGRFIQINQQNQPMKMHMIIRRFAGTFVLLSLVLAHYHSPYWLWFTAFVGFNLLQSSFTNFCPLEIMLKKCGRGPGRGQLLRDQAGPPPESRHRPEFAPVKKGKL